METGNLIRAKIAAMKVVCCFLLGMLGASSSDAQSDRYKSAQIDEAGRLYIVRADGFRLNASKSRGQSGFADALVSPDAVTVGWLETYANYPLGSGQDWRMTAGTLDLYRNGHVLHRFPVVGSYYAWLFFAGGTQVIAAIGGEHGGATQCQRRDVSSGKVLETWFVGEHRLAPGWVKAFANQLRQVP